MAPAMSHSRPPPAPSPSPGSNHMCHKPQGGFRQTQTSNKKQTRKRKTSCDLTFLERNHAPLTTEVGAAAVVWSTPHCQPKVPLPRTPRGSHTNEDPPKGPTQENTS